MHLYNAMKQEKMLASRWHDLEMVMSQQRVAHLFIGDLPQKRHEYINGHLLAAGWSVAAMHKSARTDAKWKVFKGSQEPGGEMPNDASFQGSIQQ